MKTKKVVKCNICNSDSFFWFTSNYDELNPFDIYKCNNCKSAFVNPSPSEDALKQFYNSEKNSMTNNISSDTPEAIKEIIRYEENNPNSTIDAQRIIANLKEIRPPNNNSNLFLDVGAGYGFFSNAAKNAGYEVEALESNKIVQKVFFELNKFNPKDKFFNGQYAKENQNKFSIILLSQVLEHLSLESKPVLNIRNCMKDQGVAVICVPHFRSLISMLQGKNDMFITPPEHLNFFTIKGLNKLFQSNGFKLIKIETVSRLSMETIANRFGPLSGLVYFPIQIILKLADYLNLGMFINAYYEKV